MSKRLRAVFRYVEFNNDSLNNYNNQDGFDLDVKYKYIHWHNY